MKATVFNLIILDESGSMSNMTNATISGCNETLNVIRANAKRNADSIKTFVSIYAFQNGTSVPSRYIVKNADPETVKDISADDYQPLGNTPLLDAVGSTLSELKAISETHENATGIVTIMTDGYENSSTLYTWQKVASLISQLRELGWTINLIGADIDVNAMAQRMNIHKSNSIRYEKSQQGTREMWDKFCDNIDSCYEDEAYETRQNPTATQEERNERRKTRSTFFFKK